MIIQSLWRKELQKKAIASSSNQGNQINSNSPQEHPIINTLKQEIYDLETLNKKLKQGPETLKVHNEIQRTKNDNILLHLGLWYDKNKKLKEKKKSLKRKVINLKNKIMMKKPRMAVTKKKAKKTNIDVLAQVSEGVQ